MANVESAIDFGDLPNGWALVPVRSIVRKRRRLVGTNSASYTLLSNAQGSHCSRPEWHEGQVPSKL